MKSWKPHLRRVQGLLNQGLDDDDIAERFDCSKSDVRRVISEYKLKRPSREMLEPVEHTPRTFQVIRTYKDGGLTVNVYEPDPRLITATQFVGRREF